MRRHGRYENGYRIAVGTAGPSVPAARARTKPSAARQCSCDGRWRLPSLRETLVRIWWNELLEDCALSTEEATKCELFAFRLIQDNETPTHYPGRTVVGAMLEITYAFAMARTYGKDPGTYELEAALGHLGALATVVGSEAAPEAYVPELVGVARALDRAHLVASRERMQAEARRLWDDQRIKALRDEG